MDLRYETAVGLVSPTGRVLTRTIVNQTLFATVYAQGPHHSLWFTAQLAQLASKNRIANMTLGQLIDTGQRQPQCAVPGVTGLPAHEAVLQLRYLGCHSRSVRAGPSSGGDTRFVVVAQDPQPGTLIRADQPVKLIVRPQRTRYGRCPVPPGAIVIERKASVILTRQDTKDAFGNQISTGWGCLTHRGKLRRLFAFKPGPNAGVAIYNFRIHGSGVAYEVASTAEPGTGYSLVGYDLLTGRRTAHADLPFPFDSVDEDELVVSAGGAVAWPTQNLQEAPLTPGEVWIADEHGSRRLATTCPLNVAHLRFTGHAVHWTDCGRPRTAIIR